MAGRRDAGVLSLGPQAFERGLLAALLDESAAMIAASSAACRRPLGKQALLELAAQQFGRSAMFDQPATAATVMGRKAGAGALRRYRRKSNRSANLIYGVRRIEQPIHR